MPEGLHNRRYSTVLHQFNCKKYDGADSQIENITHWLEIQDRERYYAYLYEIDLKNQVQAGIKYQLRT